MIQFGIEPHVAVATNMLALVFMSIGGSLPFAQKGVLSRDRLPGLIAVTIIGSALGAFVLLAIPKGTLELLIAIAMIWSSDIHPDSARCRGGSSFCIAKEGNDWLRGDFSLSHLRRFFQRRLRHTLDCCLRFVLRHDLLAVRSQNKSSPVFLLRRLC